jgi:hypothetical protein
VLIESRSHFAQEYASLNGWWGCQVPAIPARVAVCFTLFRQPHLLIVKLQFEKNQWGQDVDLRVPKRVVSGSILVMQ